MFSWRRAQITVNEAQEGKQSYTIKGIAQGARHASMYWQGQIHSPHTQTRTRRCSIYGRLWNPPQGRANSDRLQGRLQVLSTYRILRRRQSGDQVRQENADRPNTAVCRVRVRALVAQHALCTNNSGNSENAEVSKTMIISLKRLQVTVNEL